MSGRVLSLLFVLSSPPRRPCSSLDFSVSLSLLRLFLLIFYLVLFPEEPFYLRLCWASIFDRHALFFSSDFPSLFLSLFPPQDFYRNQSPAPISEEKRTSYIFYGERSRGLGFTRCWKDGGDVSSFSLFTLASPPRFLPRAALYNEKCSLSTALTWFIRFDAIATQGTKVNILEKLSVFKHARRFLNYFTPWMRRKLSNC